MTTIDRKLDDRVNALWAYVRDNSHSLNSDVACGKIHDLIDEAVKVVKEENTRLRESVKRLKGSNKTLREQVAALELAAEQKEMERVTSNGSDS